MHDLLEGRARLCDRDSGRDHSHRLDGSEERNLDRRHRVRVRDGYHNADDSQLKKLSKKLRIILRPNRETSRCRRTASLTLTATHLARALLELPRLLGVGVLDRHLESFQGRRLVDDLECLRGGQGTRT